MKNLLSPIYVFDIQKQLWSRPGYGGINYSDGDDVESSIAKIINEASDITVLSTELRQHCTDWPSLYHLSGTRANILRPFAAVLTGDILEIGAGCGAITRYLGESGANILALEGSPRRAAIVRSRTRDLENVTVLAEKFDQFECRHQFDMITLIGVLEYANLFTIDENPALAMLQRVRSLLKPEGKLIVAIENQLGLKYFAGAPEDHLGQPMYGIEGRYTARQPQTFGRAVLAELLEEAGFATIEFLAPFPDYKLPVSILTTEGLAHPRFDAAALAWQSAKRDPQLPINVNFSLELAWSEIFKNRLVLNLTNSFLIAASPKADQLTETSVLAYHFNAERKAPFCKQTKFIHKEENIIVEYSLLREGYYSTEPTKPVTFVPLESSCYISGKLLSYDFIRVIKTRGWSIEQVAQIMRRYILILEKLLKEFNLTLKVTQPYAILPGEFFDAVPQNIIIRDNGCAALIDKEWVMNGGIEFGHLIFRSLLLLLDHAQKFALSSHSSPLTRGTFVRQVLDSLGVNLTETDFTRYMILESAVRETVTGGLIVDATNWWPDEPLLIEGWAEQVCVLTAQIQRTEKALAEAQEFAITRLAQIEVLEKALAEAQKFAITRLDQIGVTEKALAEAQKFAITRLDQIKVTEKALAEAQQVATTRPAQIEVIEKALIEAWQVAATRGAKIESIESMKIWRLLRWIGLVRKDL
jgi:2-polyprenyl-3-methyl-5-hydroxy-6-metoxy-1,4-benzoquinol methylase